MWRLFQRILLCSLVLYAIDAKKEDYVGGTWTTSETYFHDCPENNVCVVFLYLQDSAEEFCLQNGMKAINQAGGFLWEGEDTCYPNYFNKNVKAFLAIEPKTPQRWSFTLWSYHYRDKYEGGSDEQRVETISFQFPKANISFPSENRAQFAFMKDGVWQDAEFDDGMKCIDEKYSKKCNTFRECFFKKYAFTIESKVDKKDLIDYFGVEEFYFKSTTQKEKLPFKNHRFVDKLNGRTTCHTEELSLPCYETCDPIDVTNTTSFINCTSQLWFHKGEFAKFTREWRKADEIKCNMGDWRAYWNDDQPGNVRLDKNWEVQCSYKRPSKYTDVSAGLIIGGGIAGGVVAIILLVVVGFFLFKKFKRNGNKDTIRGTTRSESNAEGKSSKNTERPPGLSPSVSSTPSRTPTPSALK